MAAKPNLGRLQWVVRFSSIGLGPNSWTHEFMILIVHEFGPSPHKLMNWWTDKLVNSWWTDKLVNSWTRELVKSWTHELVKSWTRDVMNSWTGEVVTSWTSELLNSWTRELVKSWSCEVVTSWTREVVKSWRRDVVKSWSREVVTSCVVNSIPRLRNHNATDNGNVDWSSFAKILRSRLGKFV